MSTKAKHKSSHYADLFHDVEQGDQDSVQPKWIPLDYGRNFYPFPFGFKPYPFREPVKWSWIDITFDIGFWLIFAAVMCLILALIIVTVGVRSGSRGLIVLFLVFIVAFFVLIWLRLNLARNERHRHALCHLYSKKEQARKIWAQFGESEQIYSKDVFYETSTYQGEFKVLRDGTVEVVPKPSEEDTPLKLQLSVAGDLDAQIAIGNRPRI